MKENTGTAGFDLGIPQRGAKDGYLAMIFEMALIGARILAETTDPTDPRFKRFVPLFVSMFPDRDARVEILKEISDAFDDAKDERNDVRADLEHMACVRAWGKVIDLADEFIGITHTLRIGIAGDPDWLQDTVNKTAEEVDTDDEGV
jgi:hypothetical protein